MTTKNDITGDTLVSKDTNDAYREGWDRIFGKKEKSVFEKVVDGCRDGTLSNTELPETQIDDLK